MVFITQTVGSASKKVPSHTSTPYFQEYVTSSPVSVQFGAVYVNSLNCLRKSLFFR